MDNEALKMVNSLKLAKQFADEFIPMLTNENETLASRQVYFLDKQNVLKDILSGLRMVASGTTPTGYSIDGSCSAEAMEIIEHLKEAVSNFQSALDIKPDTNNEIIPVNEETLTDAIENNKNVQEIVKDMQDLSSGITQSTQPPYNYLIVGDNNTCMLYADTVEELNSAIYKVVEEDGYTNVSVYKVQFTEIPLKQKTIFEVDTTH